MPDPKTLQNRFDFDNWSILAKTDPDAFEARRADVIEEFISHAPPDRQMRLRRLQWRIDQVRRTSTTPLSACIRISRMMWDSVLGDGGLLETLKQADGLMRDGPLPARIPAREPARVLAFKPRPNSANPH